MNDYASFLAHKTRPAEPIGVDGITTSDVNPWMHDWQREIVVWAVSRGRAAIWADMGWARPPCSSNGSGCPRMGSG